MWITEEQRKAVVFPYVKGVSTNLKTNAIFRLLPIILNILNIIIVVFRKLINNVY